MANGQEALLPSDLGTLFLGASDYYSSNDMSQYQLSALWENEDDSALRSVKFGVSKSEQDWINQNMYLWTTSCWLVGIFRVIHS